MRPLLAVLLLDGDFATFAIPSTDVIVRSLHAALLLDATRREAAASTSTRATSRALVRVPHELARQDSGLQRIDDVSLVLVRLCSTIWNVCAVLTERAVLLARAMFARRALSTARTRASRAVHLVDHFRVLGHDRLPLHLLGGRDLTGILGELVIE